MAAFHQVVPDMGEGQFKYLKPQMTKEIYNQYVKMKVIEAKVTDEAKLLQVMVGAVANALQVCTLDTGGITNLDGLATTTSFETQPE